VDFAFQAMAAQSDLRPARWRRPFNRWLDAVETGWAVPVLLASFTSIWTLYLAIAYLGVGLHPDTLEAWTLGRNFAWGYQKHPPLMGWVTAAWTAVLPSNNWSIQLLSMTNAAAALWCVDLISRKFVAGDKRVLVLLLLMLTPAYQFHAQRFNANSVLLGTWPLATLCFLRAYQTRSVSWSVALGCTAALAMVGKYYSVFLLASFAFAAMLHPERKAYFASVSPWISTMAGLLALSPHLYWLAASGAPTFGHAMAHASADFAIASRDVVWFLLGLAAATSVSAVTWVMIAGRRLRYFARDFITMDPGLKLLFYVATGTILFPVATSLSVGTNLPSLWALQGVFLFAILIVCGARYPIERFYTVNTTVLVIGIAFTTVLVAAPMHAVYRSEHGYEEGREFYRQVAERVTSQWRELTGLPLTAISGDDSLAFATAFYSPDHPHYARPFTHQHTWGVPRSMTLDRGWAALCFRDQTHCVEWMDRAQERAGASIRQEFNIQAALLAKRGLARRVVSLIVLPHAETPYSATSAGEDSSVNTELRAP
jgi:4-amino-4-deoxy-L-arabinose transferase-like glycosyltransferase